MAEKVRKVKGPDPKGNYQAFMKDGSVITFGPTINPNYKDLGYWFVSLEGKPHSTFIVNMSDPNQILQHIDAKGIERELWKNFAVHVVHGLWNV